MKKSILNFLMMSILISLIGAIALGTLEYLIGSTVLFIVCIGFVFISGIVIIPFQIMKAVDKQRPKFEICDTCETVMKINEYIKQIVKGINSNFSDLINNDYR